MEFQFDWVDAFSDQPFGGNGCAVVHGGAVLSDAVCTAYVRETSLVECTVTGPSEVADIRVKYYLASREIPFAGHPTLATVIAMRCRGLLPEGASTLETLAGIVAVEIDGDQVTMTQVAPQFGQDVPAEIVAAVGGLDAADIVGQPQVVSTGLPFCIAVVKDLATLEKVTLNLKALRAYSDFLGQADVDIMEPFWVAQQGTTHAGHTSARLLLAPPSPPEDPFTGSATGAMASYLWAKGMIEAPGFTAQQGHLMGRPGQASVEVLGPRDAISGVRVGGRGCIVMSGSVFLPAG